MAQNALTVTMPNPTPPTNFVNSGATPPNPATFDPTVYYTTIGGVQDPHYPRLDAAAGGPPYYDDGTAGVVSVFAAKKAALAVGGSSVDHEGLGTEVVLTITTPNPTAPLIQVGVGPAATQATRDAGPNNNHPSTLSGGAVPTVSGATGANNVAAQAPLQTLLTVTGTNFNRASVVNISGVPQQTNYVSATSLTVTNALKKQTAGAGTFPVTVTSNGVTTASVNWTFT